MLRNLKEDDPDPANRLIEPWIQKIVTAESILKGPLENYFTLVWGETYLPSHDLTHHRRVWGYAKDILTIIAGYLPPSDIPDPEKLITACYFHDSGMCVEKGPRHGLKGSENCTNFLLENGYDADSWKDVLAAIKNHDDKEYTGRTGMSSLLLVLSVADDLDAFGYTGIYRYAEIYLERGISPGELGLMARNNAETRFRNFLSFISDLNGCKEITDFISEHTQRYKLVDDFFYAYNKQVKGYRFGNRTPLGQCGVIEVIKLMLKERIPVGEFSTRVKQYSTDPQIIEFWNSLEKENLEYSK